MKAAPVLRLVFETRTQMHAWWNRLEELARVDLITMPRVAPDRPGPGPRTDRPLALDRRAIRGYHVTRRSTMAKRGTITNEDLAGQMAAHHEETGRRLERLERRVDELAANAGQKQPRHDLPSPPPGSARRGLERIEAIFAEVPRSAWRDVPKDASKNFRRYLYG